MNVVSSRYTSLQEYHTPASASDVSDAEWAFVAPSLTLMRLDAPQRDHDLRWIVHTRAEGRMLPHHFPPWEAASQQSQRWWGCISSPSLP
ncbi:MAG: transposase [Thermomicrobiales bacterium]